MRLETASYCRPSRGRGMRQTSIRWQSSPEKAKLLRSSRLSSNGRLANRQHDAAPRFVQLRLAPAPIASKQAGPETTI